LTFSTLDYIGERFNVLLVKIHPTPLEQDANPSNKSHSSLNIHVYPS